MLEPDTLFLELDIYNKEILTEILFNAQDLSWVFRTIETVFTDRQNESTGI
jgi:hypothetical protein